MTESKLLKPSSEHFQKYQEWLERQSTSPHTRRVYCSRLNTFLQFVDSCGEDIGTLIKNDSEIAVVLRMFKHYLKNKLNLQARSINAHLTAINNFFEYCGAKKTTDLFREEMPEETPRILTTEEQQLFLSKVAECRRLRDRAVAMALFYTGIRISECVNLNIDDVKVEGRRGRVIVRSNERYRQIPLKYEARTSMKAWLAERLNKFEENEKFKGKKIDKALFLNRMGERLTTATVDLIIKEIGKSCGLALTAHQLRHSCLANLVREHYDLEFVAEIGGHRSLETIKRYLPGPMDEK